MNSLAGHSLSPDPSRIPSFNLDPLWHLRSLSGSLHGWRDVFSTAVTTSTQSAVRLDLHLSSQGRTAAPLTTTVQAAGFSYGTLVFQAPLVATMSVGAIHDALHELAMTCSLVLQHLEALAWLEYCHTRRQRQPLRVPTARERDILAHLAQGVARAALPALLAIEVSTVKKHLENLFRKFAVHSVSQALAVGRDAGFFRYLL